MYMHVSGGLSQGGNVPRGAWLGPLAAVFVMGFLGAWSAHVRAETYLSVAENASVVRYPEAAVVLRTERLEAEDGQFPSQNTPVKEGVWVVFQKDQQIRIGHRVTCREAGDVRLHYGVAPGSVRVWRLKPYSGTYLVGWETYAEGQGGFTSVGTSLVRAVGGKPNVAYSSEILAHVSTGSSGGRSAARSVRLNGAVLVIEDRTGTVEFLAPVKGPQPLPPLYHKRLVREEWNMAEHEVFVREVQQKIVQTIDLAVREIAIKTTRYHLRSKADTLPELAAYYSVSEEGLLTANGVDPEGLLRQKWIKIPEPPAVKDDTAPPVVAPPSSAGIG